MNYVVGKLSSFKENEYAFFNESKIISFESSRMPPAKVPHTSTSQNDRVMERLLTAAQPER
jgi:hypothetical protein